MPKQLVTQRQLRNIVRLNDAVAEAKKIVKGYEAELAEYENDVFNAMKHEDGYRIESGKYSAVIEVREGSCRPPWKDVYLTHFEKEHGVSPKVEEQRLRELYPAEKKEVLAVGEKK